MAESCYTLCWFSGVFSLDAVSIPGHPAGVTNFTSGATNSEISVEGATNPDTSATGATNPESSMVVTTEPETPVTGATTSDTPSLGATNSATCVVETPDVAYECRYAEGYDIYDICWTHPVVESTPPRCIT